MARTPNASGKRRRGPLTTEQWTEEKGLAAFQAHETILQTVKASEVRQRIMYVAFAKASIEVLMAKESPEFAFEVAKQLLGRTATVMTALQQLRPN